MPGKPGDGGNAGKPGRGGKPGREGRGGSPVNCEEGEEVAACTLVSDGCSIASASTAYATSKTSGVSPVNGEAGEEVAAAASASLPPARCGADGATACTLPSDGCCS
uniref:Uncharacterized protein n=1 Tax=Triticum urartu TaxID=4572 RepID=A0A8R7PCB5_TRIUA